MLLEICNLKQVINECLCQYLLSNTILTRNIYMNTVVLITVVTVIKCWLLINLLLLNIKFSFICGEHPRRVRKSHYNDVIMGMKASEITSLTIVYSTVYSGADQRKYQSSASLAFVWGIHRGPGASNAENVSIWWRHHEKDKYRRLLITMWFQNNKMR